MRIVSISLTPCYPPAEYEKCSWGWIEKDKRVEMREKNPWFLIVRDAEQVIHAFAHFKFDFDEEIEVLYCYEVQLLVRNDIFLIS